MISKQLQKAFEFALNDAMQRRHEYVTLEHLLFALLHDKQVVKVISQCGGDVDELNSLLGWANVEADDERLVRIQNELFDLGADLTVPSGDRLRVEHSYVDRL